MARSPTIISFFCGGAYYEESAELLAADCDRLGLPHDIERLEVPDDVDWSQICRYKVGFYARKLAEHDGPVLWIDVDSRILRPPSMFDDCSLDLMGFAGRLRYIRDYDPYDLQRFWVPGLLYLNPTPATLEFVELMNEVERTSSERITDDYCLHEAWLRHETELNVGFLAPKHVAWSTAKKTEHTIFVFGLSGNVKTWKPTVVQHEPRDLMSNPRVAERIKALHDTPSVRAHILSECAADAAQSGDRATAAKLVRRAVAVDPADHKATQRYAEVLRGSGELKQAITVLEKFLAESPHFGETRRTLVKFAILDGDFALAREQIALLDADPEEKWRDYGRSARFDLYLEERAATLGLTKHERTRMWWMKGPYPGNFGDALSPYVVEKVTGRPPRFASHVKGVLAIGSIIKFAGPESQVWGSGTARMSDELAADAEYRAVRGPLTRDLILRSGGRCPKLYGDPALLLPRLYQPKPTGERHALGIIRHLSDRNHDVPIEGVKEISIMRVGHDELEAFIDEVASCDRVLSTSLHGLIAAHAYGIPARWCAFGLATSGLRGDGTKFEDYFRSVKLRSQTPLDLSRMDVIDASLARHIDDNVRLKFRADDLLEAFPA